LGPRHRIHPGILPPNFRIARLDFLPTGRVAGVVVLALAVWLSVADAAQAHHYCAHGVREAGERVKLWRDARCAGPNVVVGEAVAEGNRPDFRAFRDDESGSTFNVDNTRSSLAIAPGNCVRLYDGVGYTGEVSNLLCTPPNPEDWGLFAFNDRVSSMRVCRVDRQTDCGPGPIAPPPPPDQPPPPGGLPPPLGGGPVPLPPAADDPTAPSAGPTPDPSPACNGGSVSLGPFVATATCFRRDGSAYVATGRVRIAGVDISVSGAEAEVRVEPRALSLSTRGSTQLRVGGMVLYQREIDWQLGGELRFSVARDLKLRGLPVTGSAALTANARTRTVSIGLNLQLPSVLGGVTGATTIQAGGDGVIVDDITVTAGSARIGSFEVRDLSLAYTRVSETAYHFDGQATLVLPAPLAPQITGRLGFGIGDDYFRVGGSLDGINRPLSHGIFLQRIRFDIQINPLRLSGGIGVSAGPRLLGREAISIDGDFTYEDLVADRYSIGGSARIVDIEVASGLVSYQTDGRFDMSARINFLRHGVGFEGQIIGWVDGASAFNFQGSGSVRAGPFSVTGEGVISSAGIAACRSGWGPRVGFGYAWSGNNTRIFASSCNIGPWVVQRAARAAQAPPTFRSFGVGRSQRVAVFSVVGTSLPPKVVLTGPGGRVLAVTPDDPAGGVDDGRVLLFQNPEDRTTYIAVDRPAAGLYRLSLAPGSHPAERFRVARALSRPAVRGRVAGKGRRRALRYRFTRARGRSVVFYEQGRDTRKRLRQTRRPKGTIRFRVPDGRAGRRDIVAVVRQSGLTQSAGVIARYKAPPARRPGRPGNLRGRVRRGKLVVRWGRARRAASYEVRVRVSDGRSVLFLPKNGKRTVRLQGLRRGHRARVTVRGLTPTGRRGPRASLRVRSARPRGSPRQGDRRATREPGRQGEGRGSDRQ
jgi:hypothetical protein